MPKIAITEPHVLTVEQAKASAEHLCTFLSEQFGILCLWVTETGANLSGVGIITGRLQVEAQRLALDLDLSFALTPMKGRIEETIRHRLRMCLPGKQEEQMLFGLGSTGNPLGNGIAWSAPFAGIDVVVTFAPDPVLASACERVRLFLAEADLTDQSLADARQASQLRHRLRTPSREVLRAAVLFLGGMYPARPGQRELVTHLLGLLRPHESQTITVDLAPRPVTGQFATYPSGLRRLAEASAKSRFGRY